MANWQIVKAKGKGAREGWRKGKNKERKEKEGQRNKQDKVTQTKCLIPMIQSYAIEHYTTLHIDVRGR